jgi:hypothetical protein
MHARLASEPGLPASHCLKRLFRFRSSMAMATTRRISRTANTHQIPIEPAAAGCSAFRDFVHCRFADAGRRRVWLRSPTAGIRKPLQKRSSLSSPRGRSRKQTNAVLTKRESAARRNHSHFVGREARGAGAGFATP